MRSRWAQPPLGGSWGIASFLGPQPLIPLTSAATICQRWPWSSTVLGDLLQPQGLLCPRARRQLPLAGGPCTGRCSPEPAAWLGVRGGGGLTGATAAQCPGPRAGLCPVPTAAAVCVCVSVSACVGVCAHVRSCVCTYMQVCEVCARVSMCVHMSAHMHAHGCMYTCVHACDACLYVHVRARVHPCLHMFVSALSMCVHVHACLYACMCACAPVCMIARAFLCACVCVHCVHVCAHACDCMRTCACTRAFVHTCVHVCVSLRLDAEKATGPARAQEGNGGGSRGHGWPRGPGSSQVMAITPAAYPNRPRRCTREVTSTLFPR